MEIVKDAVAGTLESSDALVRIGPSPEPGLHLTLESVVQAQFGGAIEHLARVTLAQLGITQAQIAIDDKGALECVLRARVQAAALRAAGKEPSEWSLPG
ncbi:citrate lyase acyl carrier protein [Chimaeribacter arupi]|uniref:citrate lyase acyl carrier protein n=1 Tax=Chimaeribacter arupi TaxID=2060066 RepID=UPI002712002E|nr:citrate lyase acyl carrier protein [Chimaeribacter arupi]WKZ91850.1 citrate lyase acyl carrier protein [Chimaeribacter arupi]